MSAMDNILETHEERRAARDEDDELDMVDVLLREGAMRVSLTDGVIRAVLTDVFGAALDTTTTVLQWVMAELMANPRVMHRVQSETRRVLAGQATIQESTLKDMHYLRSTIKETLHLHPPAPFFPRVCLQDCKIHGFDMPRGATVLTNVWAISRDPKYWDEPQKFKPERFEGEGEVDFRGLDFEFIPFGVGRRICPGIGFAHASIEIALASLLYHFDWDLPIGVESGKLDMTEVFGVTLSRKADLFLHPIPHDHL